MTPKNSFFSLFFDLSFSSFIATRLVGIIYFLSVLGVGLLILGFVVTAFNEGLYENFLVGIIYAIGTLIISLGIGVVYLLFIRVGLEGLVAGIKTAENTTEIKEFVRQIRNEKA